jgi:hypothetical protein
LIEKKSIHTPLIDSKRMLRLATCAALCLVSGASAKTTLLRSRAPETVPAVDSIGNARTEFNVAKQNAMQFAQAGMGAAEAVAPKVYQVSPGIKGGLAFEPSGVEDSAHAPTTFRPENACERA